MARWRSDDEVIVAAVMALVEVEGLTLEGKAGAAVDVEDSVVGSGGGGAAAADAVVVSWWKCFSSCRLLLGMIINVSCSMSGSGRGGRCSGALAD
jgi:hypothetical protein